MSPQEPHRDRDGDVIAHPAQNENDSVANKLSKELSNWRKRRTTHGRARRHDGGNSEFQSDAARTIKVRGHETLVVRKPRVAQKPAAASDDHSR